MIGEPNEEAIPESQVQERLGEEFIRVYSPDLVDLIEQLLDEQKKTNLYLSAILGEEL